MHTVRDIPWIHREDESTESIRQYYTECTSGARCRAAFLESTLCLLDGGERYGVMGAYYGRPTSNLLRNYHLRVNRRLI